MMGMAEKFDATTLLLAFRSLPPRPEVLSKVWIVLDEVPQEQRAHPLVAALEQLSPIVEDHLEQWRERRFQVAM